MTNFNRLGRQAAVACGLLMIPSVVSAVQIRVTVENLAPANSVSLAPLRFGFSNGTFDAFDNNAPAFLLGQPDISQAPIVTIAEGGSGSTWFPAFQAAEPNADLGSVFDAAFPPIVPGEINSAVFEVDPTNQFFTFGTMVVPSNDHFLGNASPTRYRVFDGSGNLILPTIVETASLIWDAGSETQDPANAAFLPGGVNDNRVNENNPVTFNFSNLQAFNGLLTAAGYTFDSSLLASDTPVLRVSFEVVPEPSSLLLGGLALVGLAAARTRRTA